jgi:hypothetical protein
LETGVIDAIAEVLCAAANSNTNVVSTKNGYITEPRAR